MATKPKPKSNVSRSKKSPIKFHWWMAAVLVIVIAVIGIAVLRFSRASGPTVSYNASQIQSLPYYRPVNVVSSNFKGSNTIRLSQVESAFGFRLQLYPGNYVICVHGVSPPEGSGVMYVLVSNGPGRLAKNTTSGFTPSNTSICVAFDMLQNPTYTTEFLLRKTTGTGYVDITAITIEAR